MCMRMGREGERGGCTHFMHSRGRMTIGPRILMEHVGFSPTAGRHRVHRARRAVRVFDESREG